MNTTRILVLLLLAFTAQAGLCGTERGSANKATKLTMPVRGGSMVRNLPAGTKLEILGEKVPGILSVRIGRDEGTLPAADVTPDPTPTPIPTPALPNTNTNTTPTPTPSEVVDAPEPADMATPQSLEPPTDQAVPEGTSPDVGTLPWEPDYASALAKAKMEKRPIFLLYAPPEYVNDKRFQQFLNDARLRSAMKEFVYVHAYGDKKLSNQFDAKTHDDIYPIRFIDSQTEKIVSRTALNNFILSANELLSKVIKVRAHLALPLMPEMQSHLAQDIKVDNSTIKEMCEAGDMAGLLAYLKPLEGNTIRCMPLLVIRLHFPTGILPWDVSCTTNYDRVNIPKSGLCVVRTADFSKDTLEHVTINAPGCLQIQNEVPFNKDTAFMSREYTLRPLPAEAASSFQGRVLWPDGRPAANAIVRIHALRAVTRTDKDGNFSIAPISPGKYHVRAEAPGGEFQGMVKVKPGSPLQKDLTLKAVTTIGIRWAIQTNVGSVKLSGNGVQTGEAYFSPDKKTPFFLLKWGILSARGDFRIVEMTDDLLQDVSQVVRDAMKAIKPGTPVFFFESDPNHLRGLHREKTRFENIGLINGGKPFEKNAFFERPIVLPVRAGDVYTLPCCDGVCYAKMEITSVTIVPQAP